MNYEDFLNAYIECALWSSNDNSDDSGGEALDANYDADNLAPETLKKFQQDCKSFIESEADDLELSELDSGQAGHDFWLTRNGHGAGFWDRGIGEVGERLSKASKVYGGVDLVVCDDGMIYC